MRKKMKPYFKYLLSIIFLAICLSELTYGQSYVAITVDDVPGTGKMQKENYKSKLMSTLDSLNIPVTIFVTEGLIYKGDNADKNFELLNNWMSKSYTTIGYHSTEHSRYSAVGLDSFKNDVEKGENVVREMAKKNGKSVDYFRLPYNDLGKDSVEHANIENYLSSRNFKVAPFTVESEDYAYCYVYEYYLAQNDSAKANAIAKDYVSMTIACFDFFDSLSLKVYGKQIKHIYLCHDNVLNADYLPVIVSELKKKNYTFISFGEALQDPLYHQKDIYYKKWGISWLYRWMENQKDVSTYQKQEPEGDIYPLYQKLVDEQKNK